MKNGGHQLLDNPRADIERWATLSLAPAVQGLSGKGVREILSKMTETRCRSDQIVVPTWRAIGNQDHLRPRKFDFQ